MNIINICSAQKGYTITLGRRGENAVTEVVFNFNEWIQEFGQGTVSLLIKRNCDINPYPVILSVDGDTVTWIVTSTDTACMGGGAAEFIYTVDEKIAKSVVFRTTVLADIGEPADPPDPYESWLNTLVELGEETAQNAQEAEEAQRKAEEAQAAAENAAEIASEKIDDAFAERTVSYEDNYSAYGGKAAYLADCVANGITKLSVLIDASSAISSIQLDVLKENIYPQSKNTENGYVANSYLASGGAIVSDNGYDVSEYIPVEAGKVYLFNHGSKSNTFRMCFYKSDKTYLSDQGYGNRAYHILTVPNNAAFVRMTVYLSVNYVREVASQNTISFGTSLQHGVLDVLTGTLTNTDSGTVTTIDVPSIEIDNGYNMLWVLENGSISATYKVKPTDLKPSVNELFTEVNALKAKTDGFQSFQGSPFFRNVRWGASAFNSHYHSADDGISLFTSSTTATQYFSMFNTLVSDYTGYADYHEMGLASDGTTTMYYYTFNPITNQDGDNYKRPKIIVSAGQHGFEKTANFGLYWFAKNLLEDWEDNDFLAYVRNHVQLIIMPMLNPYGFDHDTYTNANGVNLNRNWGTTGWSKGTPGTTTYGGEEPFDQVETQYARDVILANLDALWLCDYHNNGQVAPSSAVGYLWHSFALVTYDDEYFKKAIDAAKWHIDDTTGHLYKDYPTICSYVNSGNFTDNNAPSHQGLIVAYAREQGIMAATMEGGAAFIDSGNRYTSPIHHMNADLIGNWVRCLLGTYSRFVY